MTERLRAAERPKVLVAQIGARRHYAVPQALQSVDCLERLVTDACAEVGPWRWLNRVLPGRAMPLGLRRLLDRKAPLIPREKIGTLPWLALSAAWERSSGQRLTEIWAQRNAKFGHAVVRAGFAGADTVYAFNGAALEIFAAAKPKGLCTVLDQSAAPWRWNRKLLEEEALAWPGWDDTQPEVDVTGRLADREEQEWQFADRIICGSEFARRGAVETGAPPERCLVVPYGEAHGQGLAMRERPRARRDGPLRVLFVGTLQLRKGIQYLWQAKRLLSGEGVVVRVVGPSLLSRQAMDDIKRDLDIVGPVPRSRLAEHYSWADVFVLPTLSEGSANVVHEALAAGLPVITTPSSGAALHDGFNALIVPARDAAALANALLRIKKGDWHPQSPAMGGERSRGAGLADYGRRLVEAITAAPKTRRPGAALAQEQANMSFFSPSPLQS